MHWLAEIQCWKSAAYLAHSWSCVQGTGSNPNTQEHKIWFFSVTGIFSVNQNAFFDYDFVQAHQSDQHQMATLFDHSFTEDDQWQICVAPSQLGLAANEEMSTSEPSTSTTTPQTMSHSLSMASVLLKIRSVWPVSSLKKFAQRHRPMKSAVLTSSESKVYLKEKQHSMMMCKRRRKKV